MEATQLLKDDYWKKGEGNDIRLNPNSTVDAKGLNEALESLGIGRSVVLATSGTGGNPKFVVLEKRSLIASASAVNQFCEVTGDDVWLGGLSTFHVGGLGIYCRAWLSGSEVRPMPWHQWTRDGSAFLEACQDATLTSLTPIHLHDLVQAQVRCPALIRGVFIGGGFLRSDLAERARTLGWPIWPTYGMTEAGSQIATSREGDPEWMTILPDWEVRTTDEGRLQIDGPALMKGYLKSESSGGEWLWHPARDDGRFHTTGDRVVIRDGKLHPAGRWDDNVKVLGELVSPGRLEQILPPQPVEILILPLADQRKENRLIAVVECDADPGIIGTLHQWSQTLPPYLRVDEVLFEPAFPRSESGKIDRVALTRMITSKKG